MTTPAALPPPPTPDPATVDVIYNHLKDVTEKQFGDAKDIDDKMVKVFTAAAVVLGLAGLNRASIPAHRTATVILLVWATTAFFGVTLIAGWELWVRRFRALRFGDTLWTYEWTHPPERVKRQIIEKVSKAYERNRQTIQEKGNLLTAGLMVTGIEVVLVAISIIVRMS